MDQIPSLKNNFLIAMPTLLDPHFFRSVTYICEHDQKGAIGISINQPLNIDLGDILKQMGLDIQQAIIKQRMVFSGGPIHRERGFILHPNGTVYQHTIAISDSIALTTSPDILRAIAENKGPPYFLVALGYAQWEAGQLEQELASNAWLYGPANNDIIFHLPIDQRWKAAAASMGVDVDRLSDNIGHA